jgi:hypothetical protein
MHALSDFVDLAGTEQCGGIDSRSRLLNSIHDQSARAFRQRG